MDELDLDYERYNERMKNLLVCCCLLIYGSAWSSCESGGRPGMKISDPCERERERQRKREIYP